MLDAAEVDVMAATVTYAEWKRRYEAGLYADPLATRWGAHFDKIARVRHALDPPPPPPPPLPESLREWAPAVRWAT